MPRKAESFWFGVPRKEIEWYPTIVEEKCIGCGVCVVACGRRVFRYDYENKKSKVVYPYNCMVACQTCTNLCPSTAISFTPGGETARKRVQKLVKDWNIIQKAKKQLKEKEAEFRLP